MSLERVGGGVKGTDARYWIGYDGGVYDLFGRRVGEVCTTETGHAAVEFFDPRDMPVIDAWFCGPDPEGRP